MEARPLALELQHVDAGYGDLQVLKDVSLEIRKGDIVTIIGANGAGKSTLLKAVFGLVQPTSGMVLHEGTNISSLGPGDTLKRGISFIPGGRSNFPAMSVQENLEMGAYTRADQKEVRADIDALCERFPLLQEKRKAMVGNLSGGQQQIVEIAIAMMLKPDVMLIDEPTIGLAPLIVNEVFQVIREINQAGTTLVLVEQNAKRALEISDFGYVLELGTVRYQGSADELANFEEVYRAYLGER